MYTLTDHNAIGILRGMNKRWSSVDISSISVAEIIATYRAMQIELLPDGAIEPVYLQIGAIANDWISYSGSVEELLDEITEVLPTTDYSVTLSRDVARYYDAFKLRYKVLAVDDNNMLATAPGDVEDTPHLRIDRADALVDSADAVSNILVNVNGFYHLAKNIGNKGIFVQDGYSSIKRAGQNAIGLWDFRSLGGFTVLPDFPGVTISPTGTVLIPISQPLTDKAVFFFIAGYFFPVDGTIISQVSPNLFSINFAHESMRLVARYYEAANYIDLTSIKMIAKGVLPNSIIPNKLYNAAAITAWLALSQSFAVIINRRDVYFERKYVKRTNLVNQYLCYLDRNPEDISNEVNNVRLTLDPPDLPLVLELGRHPSYWVTTEGWTHSLTIYSNRVGQLLYETGQPAEHILTSGSNQPGSPGAVQHAYLLEVGSNYRNVAPIIPIDPPPPTEPPNTPVWPNSEFDAEYPSDKYWLMHPLIDENGTRFWIPLKSVFNQDQISNYRLTGGNDSGAINFFYANAPTITPTSASIVSSGNSDSAAAVLFRASDGIPLIGWNYDTGFTTTDLPTLYQYGLITPTIAVPNEAAVAVGSILMAISVDNSANTAWINATCMINGWPFISVLRSIRTIITGNQVDSSRSWNQAPGELYLSLTDGTFLGNVPVPYNPAAEPPM